MQESVTWFQVMVVICLGSYKSSMQKAQAWPRVRGGVVRL